LINDIAAKLDYDFCDLDDLSEVPDFEMIKKNGVQNHFALTKDRSAALFLSKNFPRQLIADGGN